MPGRLGGAFETGRSAGSGHALARCAKGSIAAKLRSRAAQRQRMPIAHGAEGTPTNAEFRNDGTVSAG